MHKYQKFLSFLLVTRDIFISGLGRMCIYTDMQPHGKLGERWEKYLQSEAKPHFLELSSITYALIAGRTKYSPKYEDLFIKLLRNDMTWFMNDMIWFNEKG